MLGPWMKEHGIKIGRDMFFLLLSKYNLLIRIRKKHKIRTTNSNHWLHKYPNLTIGLQLIRIEQLWVADITYLKIKKEGFAYLAIITDAFSHKIVGYDLELHMHTSLCLEALSHALRFRNTTQKTLIHHSDRGAQYCSNEYTQLLRQNAISISMTQSGDPLENPIAERVNGIIKNEYIKPLKPETFLQAKKLVGEAILKYNHERPHMSINYHTPAEIHFYNKKVKRVW